MNLRNTIIIGTLIRLVLMPFSSHPFDVYGWYNLSVNILGNPAIVRYFPPMLFYTLVPIAHTYRWASSILGVSPIPLASLPKELNPGPEYGIIYVTDPVFNFLVKVPFLLADILVTVIMLRLAGKLFQDQKKAEWAATLWFLNPYLILISAVWGMFDTLPALFSLASVWFLAERRPGLSAFSLAVATAYKLYPILFLLPTILFIRRLGPSTSFRKTIYKYVTVFVVSSIVLFLPATPMVLGFSRDLFAGSPESVLGARGALGFGLTFWSVLLAIPLDSFFVIVVSNLLVVVCLFLTYFKVLKSKFGEGVLSLLIFQLSCVFSIFIGFRYVCEQFFVWALPSMVLLSVAGKVKTSYYKGLSALAFAYALIHGVNAIFFFLPTWPWFGAVLLSAIRFVRGSSIAAIGYRQAVEVINQPHMSPITATLSGLGIIFTLLIVRIFVNLLRDTRD